MSIYRFIQPEAEKFIRESEHLTRLVSELHAVYGVYPYNYRFDSMSLIYPNGMLFGLAFVETVRNDDGVHVCYNVVHNKIKKEKGRGELSRMTRKSRSLKMLMVQLKKEVPAFKPKLNELYGNLPHIYEKTNSHVRNKLAKGIDGGYYLNLDSKDCENITRHIINGEPISQQVFNICKENMLKLMDRDTKRSALNERLTYFDNAYVIYLSERSPAVFAEVRKAEISTAAGMHMMYVPVEDWRIVNDVTDLPINAASLLSMWRVGAENELRKYESAEETQPISKMFPMTDSFFEDYDIVTRYDNHTVTKRDAFVIVAKGPSDEKPAGY